MNAPAFTAEQKAAAAKREVRQRRHVYPRLVAEGRMTQAMADEQIAIMEAIAADYEAEGKRQGSLPLFGGQ